MDLSKVLSLLPSFVFFIWQAEQCARRVMSIACPLSKSRSWTAKRSAVHYVTPAALQANSISGCLLGTFRVSLFLPPIDRIFWSFFFIFFSFFLFFVLSLLLGIASSSFIRERAFFWGVSYFPKWLRNSNRVTDHFWKEGKRKDPVPHPCTFPLWWRLMPFISRVGKMASSAPTRNPRLFTTRHHFLLLLLLLLLVLFFVFFSLALYRFPCRLTPVW